jgi:hypothetical protein
MPVGSNSPETAPRAGVAIGRIGALAVALGIGTAAFAMPAVAAADTQGSAGSGDMGSSGSSSAARGASGGHTASSGAGRRGGSGQQTVSEGRVPAPAAGAAAPSQAELMPVEEVVLPEIAFEATAPAARAPQQPLPTVETVATARLSQSASPTQQRTGRRGPAQLSDTTADSAPLGAPRRVSAPSPAATIPTRSAAVGNPAPAPGQPAPALPALTASAGAAAPVTLSPPVMSPAATPNAPGAFAHRQVPEVIQNIDALIQSHVRTVFNQLINWVATLPVNDFTTWMQGGLLMVRKSLFNQTASVNSVQTYNTSKLVKGKIDVLDPEGDAYTVELVEKPTQGIVELAATSQTDGRGNTKYTYTPGQGYSGSDQFVVKISPAGGGGINVFHPFGALDTRYYTVKVGSGAVSDTALGATAKDTLDTTLFLGNAGATVSVEKKGLLFPSYSATVTLSAASAARAFDWQDTNGRKGSVPVGKMLTENWDVYGKRAAENGVKPLLMFKFRDAGADNVVFVDVDKVTKNADGSFQFTGHLSPEVADLNGRVDRSDFTGISYEKAYQNFLSASGLKDCKSGAVCKTVGKVGTLGFTTLSPSAFVQGGGHDYPQTKTPPKDASATQTYPGAMGPGTTDVNQGNGSANNGNTSSNTALLSAMTPWGNNGSFITATNLATGDDANNGVFLYTINAPTGGGGSSAPTWGTGIELAGSGWNSQVNTMTTYTQTVTDDSGNPIPLTFAGTVLPPDYTVTGSVLPAGPYSPSGVIGFQNYYGLNGSAGAAGTTPASFSGFISGTTLTVSGITSGTINPGDAIVGGPASGTQIGPAISGTGGVGTYSISPSQNWPDQVGSMTSASAGTNLQLFLSEFPTGLDPSTLVGGSVSGNGVAENTTITGYTGTAGSGFDATAAYTVSAAGLAVQQNLTIVADGYNEWGEPTGPVSYALGGTLSATGTANYFQGFIDGTTLSVTDVPLGSINIGDTIVSGSYYPTTTQIQAAGTGSGGVGTYVITPSQDWPPTISDQMVSGQFGSTLQLMLPPGTNPRQLIGASVDGAVDGAVAQGTTITAVNRYTGSAETGYSATFTVNTSNLAAGAFSVTAINQLQLDTSNLPGVDPASLVGAAVSGTGIAAGTTITSYSGTDPSTDVATYTISIGAVNQNAIQTFSVSALSNQISLDLADGVAPDDLLGATVVGDGIAPGTFITAYSGNSGGSAVYTLSNTNALVSATGSYAVTFGTPTLTLTVPNGVNPGSLIGQAITGTGVAGGTVITGFVADSASPTGTYTFTVNNNITAPTTDVTITTPTLYQTHTGLVVGLADGSVQYWNGLGCSQTTSSGCTGAANPNGQANYGGGWTQLQSSNGAGWGEDNPVNTLVTLPNNLGLVVGLGNGSVQLWNSTIMLDGTILPGTGAPSGCSTDNPASCWIQLQGTGWDSAVNAMIPSGQNGGLVVGLADGSVQQLDSWDAASWNTLQVPGGESDGDTIGWGSGTAVNTVMPYDGSTFLGSIGGTPVVASGGTITTPSWAPANSAELAAAGAACTTSYTSGSGVGCGGYVLTVQQAAGQPLRVGQTLYGGAALVGGTTITAQISDGDGNLCSVSCSGGGEGLYFVDNPQLVAPGTPMSASDGTSFVVGLSGGAVEQYTGSGWNELQNNAWGSVVNTMIPWRDGLVVGLNNGAVFYWSPSNNPQQSNGSYLNSSNANALSYTGSTISPEPNTGDQGSGWSELASGGWSNAVTAMVPLGDGFAVGLTATTDSQNGAVEYYTGFGPASTTQAFGYTAGPNGPVALNSQQGFTTGWYEIASSTDLSSDTQGSIQQLIPLSVYTMDPSGSGTVLLAQSVIAGQTNNGIYAWTGSTQNPEPADVANTTSPWQMIQAADTGSKPVLTGTQLGDAWNFISGGALPNFSTSFGQPGGVGDPTAGTGDPVFGLQSNQAYCSNNNSCSGSGDYYTFSFNYLPNGDGVLYAWPSASADVQADINLQLAGYGYIFVPNGVWDKFHPDDYSLGMVLGAAAGPSAVINVPNPSITLGPDNIPVYSKNEPIEGGLGGIVTISSGITIGAGANATLGNSPITLASYSFIPGILLTWNVAGYPGNLAMTGAYTTESSAATFDEIVGDLSDPSASANVTITPSLNLSWGYTIPDNVPFLGGDGLVNLGMGYSNPVELQATANLDLDDAANSTLALTLTASGQLVFNAALLPGITSLLSWSDTLTLYNYNDNIATIQLSSL